MNPAPAGAVRNINSAAEEIPEGPSVFEDNEYIKLFMGYKDMGFTEINRDGMTIVQADILSRPSIRHAFTTRFGGFSSGVFASLNLAVGRGDDRACVLKNYEKLCAYLKTDPSKIVFSAQVHEDGIRKATARDSIGDIFSQIHYRADALITDEPGLPLMIFIADCIPILLSCPDVSAVGAVHAGWRGTAMNIAGKTIRRMCDEYGCEPENILAAIGPGIGSCCFETGPEVPGEILKLGLDRPEEFIINTAHKPRVDLKAVNRALLIREGLRPENIAVSRECTMCKSDKYWSHRATGGQGEPRRL